MKLILRGTVYVSVNRIQLLLLSCVSFEQHQSRQPTSLIRIRIRNMRQYSGKKAGPQECPKQSGQCHVRGAFLAPRPGGARRMRQAIPISDTRNGTLYHSLYQLRAFSREQGEHGICFERRRDMFANKSSGFVGRSAI